jgi:hypothetical protein
MNDAVIQDLERMTRDRLFLSLEDIAGFLGVPRKAVYNWTRRVEEARRLNKLVVGRNVRVARTELISWLRREYQLRQP